MADEPEAEPSPAPDPVGVRSPAFGSTAPPPTFAVPPAPPVLPSAAPPAEPFASPAAVPPLPAKRQKT